MFVCFFSLLALSLSCRLTLSHTVLLISSVIYRTTQSLHNFLASYTNVYFCMLVPSHAALQILLSFVKVPNQSCLFWPELIVPFRIVNAAVFTTPTFISIPFICHFLFPLLTHLDRSATQAQKQRPEFSEQLHCFSVRCFSVKIK